MWLQYEQNDSRESHILNIEAQSTKVQKKKKCSSVASGSFYAKLLLGLRMVFAECWLGNFARMRTTMKVFCSIWSSILREDRRI